METLLEIRDLNVSYSPIRGLQTQVLRGVSLQLRKGEALGILGESGSGKSTLALSLIGMLPKSAMVLDGSVRLCAQELLSLPESKLEKIRGAEIALIFQDPNLVLYPFLPVGKQIEEVLRAHTKLSRAERRQRALDSLERSGVRNVRRIFSSYPHELSGGEKQRVLIAQAIACDPVLLVADEPTSALDTTVQAEILKLLKSLCTSKGIALLLISHDPSVLATVTDQLAVIYAGEIVE